MPGGISCEAGSTLPHGTVAHVGATAAHSDRDLQKLIPSLARRAVDEQVGAQPVESSTRVAKREARTTGLAEITLDVVAGAVAALEVPVGDPDGHVAPGQQDIALVPDPARRHDCPLRRRNRRRPSAGTVHPAPASGTSGPRPAETSRTPSRAPPRGDSRRATTTRHRDRPEPAPRPRQLRAAFTVRDHGSRPVARPRLHPPWPHLSCPHPVIAASGAPSRRTECVTRDGRPAVPPTTGLRH